MDPFAVFALTLGMVIAASEQAAVMEQYAARARQAQAAAEAQALRPAPAAYAPMAPIPPPVPGWAAGAAVGSQVGALVSASNPVLRCGRHACAPQFDPRPVVAGAVIGGLIGHAASQPPVVVAQAGAPSPAPHRDPAASRAFQEHWQDFMQPSANRSSGATPGWGR